MERAQAFATLLEHRRSIYRAILAARVGAILGRLEPVNTQLQEIADRIDTSVEELVAFLDSPTGRRLRKGLATGLILSVPLVMRLPWLRRSPIGKLIELGGGTAIVVKVAELIRDWERGHDGLQPSVIAAPRAQPSAST